MSSSLFMLSGTYNVIILIQQFHNFQGIKEPLRKELLTKVNVGALKLSQAGAMAKLSKQLEIVRRAFVLGTDSKSWEYARSKYPDYTTDEQLEPFVKYFTPKRGNV